MGTLEKIFGSRIIFFLLCLAPLRSLSRDPCFRFEKNKFLCPMYYAEVGGFQMSITPLKEVTIECHKLNTLDAAQFPNVTVPKMNFLRLRFCPLPQEGFRNILEVFSTEDVIMIEFEFGNFKERALKKEVFEGLKNLKFLNLAENKLREMDEDIFMHVPNLLALELKRNELEVLEPNLFDRTPVLQWLDISDNRLENLPEGLFRSLGKLEYLRLWTNELRVINGSTFEGLFNLKTLELSDNKIQRISENAFEHLKNLANLSLSRNHLRSVAPTVFKINTKLQSLHLNDNPNFQLSDRLFSNLTLLQDVDLSECNLNELPERIFENSPKLKFVALKRNHLNEIQKNLFSHLVHLEEIDLGDNRIESIEEIFKNLKKLKKLFLQNNKIVAIREETISDLIRLEEINLEKNQINYIHPRAFFNNDGLRIINLSKNQYSGKDVILKDLIYLEEVDFSHNRITRLEEVITLDNKPLFERLDLSHNLLNGVSLINLQALSDLEIHLDHNNISVVDFSNADLLEGPHVSIIHLGNNPLQCNCHNFDLLRYFNGETPRILEMFNIRPEGLTCATPEVLKSTPLSLLPLSTITCEFREILTGESGCPEECSCSWRPFDTSILINCTDRNLIEFPKIVPRGFKWINFSQIEVNLEKNHLVTANLTGYDNVTKLFLSHNKLTTISWIPAKLQVLELGHNRLQSLSFRVLEALNTTDLVKLSLRDNPWICECGSENFTAFLRQHSKQLDSRHIYCVNTTTRLIDLNENDLCQDFLLLYVTLTLSVLLLILSISVVFYYRYQQELKIWLFSKKWCLWWISEEELDQDKIYDAFISYSHRDEDFVIHSLVSQLESGSKPYNLCLHYRNWVPGELINTQIVESVANSKRTIVVLSKNFVESVWGKAEFQQAHAEAMAEGRARVIVVIYGEVDVESLDDVLKMYLKTKTYLKWGDPYFWDKLKYALPHRRRKARDSCV